jgi:hypothetical protein
MEKNNKRITISLLIVGLLVLVGTNIATYYLSGGRKELPVEEETTVIRYEPTRRDSDSEIGVIQDALDTI